MTELIWEGKYDEQGASGGNSFSNNTLGASSIPQRKEAVHLARKWAGLFKCTHNGYNCDHYGYTDTP